MCNADYPEQIELKDKTKQQFDSGVIIYQSGEYQKAWEIFLQILTINPRDKADMFFLNRTATYLVEGIKITPEAKVDSIILYGMTHGIPILMLCNISIRCYLELSMNWNEPFNSISKGKNY